MISSPLKPAVLVGLAADARQLMELYYGLTDGPALDQTELAVRLGLSRHQVSEQLHRTAAQLLGPEVVHGPGDRGGTTADRCELCRTGARGRA